MTLSTNIEITLEANPTSVEAKKFKSFKEAGVNRVSVGIQSFNPEKLKFLGRNHSAPEAIKAIELAQQYFQRYTFDLIYALPNQTIKQWQEELDIAAKLLGHHISLYQLTIEKGTPFFSLFKQGAFTLPDADASATLYEFTDEYMKNLGLYRYEVSNYAVYGHESIHNLNYWRYGDYLGIGPGAHGRVTIDGHKYATINLHHPENWLSTVSSKSTGLQKMEKLSAEQAYQEKIMMGLRLQEGIKESDIINQNKMHDLIDKCMLQLKNGKISCTQQGTLLLNSIISELI